jgi:hypothetical protein
VRTMGVQRPARLMGRDESARPRNVGEGANEEGVRGLTAKVTGWRVTVMVRRTKEAKRKPVLGGEARRERWAGLPDRGRYIADIGQPWIGGREPRQRRTVVWENE